MDLLFIILNNQFSVDGLFHGRALSTLEPA
jgi:hypothetical protein